jgi:long-chain fatty acid transport protein
MEEMKITKRLFKLSALGLLALSSQLYAAGYRLEFQSASVLADAGEAAVVEDAGTNWYNSAGLVDLPMQVVMSGIDVYAPTTFHGTMDAPSTLNQFGPPISLFADNFAADGTASSHPNVFLPALHFSAPVSNCIALGLSVVPAFGFTEDYGENSLVRYNLTRVYTKTIDVSPSIAFKINPQWSLGFGPDIHYFSVQSKVHVRTQGTLAPFVGTVGDSSSRFTADDWAYGGHIGLLYKYSEATRIGLNYRSKMNMNLDGYSSFTLDQGAFYETNTFKLPIPLPASTTLSIYHDMSPCWALMGTIAYDQWSSIQNYHARNYIQPPTPDNPTGILSDVTVPQHMSDTVDLSMGTHYKINDKLMLRASFKYLGTPTKDAYRNVNFPDNIKFGINLGARYQVNCKIALDFIYGHVFVPSAHIHDVNPVSGAVATGHNNTSIDLLGGQLVWNL